MDRSVIDDRYHEGLTISIARRFAAVLSADAKGYSRLMGEDDVWTVRTITAHRETMKDAVIRFNGRVVDTSGDNLLAEFASAVDAVACAVEIQSILGAHNTGLPDDRRLDFRIGVNLGDILADGERIYGDTVNVAARIEALADAGGVCVSGTIYEQIANKLAVVWESLGEQSVKNIPRPVRVLRALLDTSRPAPGRPHTAAASDRPSLTVPPFRELAVGEDHQYVGSAW